MNIVRSRELRKLADEDVSCLEIPAPAGDPGAYGEAEDLPRLRAAMANMEPRLVAILNLRYKDGYTWGEIAKLLRKPAATVAVEMFRARAELKKLIRENYRETQENRYQSDCGSVLADSSH